MKTPIILSNTQERKILESLNNNKRIHAGSSRIVFDLDNEIAEELGLEGRWVAKLVMGINGQNQMHLEVETYLKYPEGPLARIGAYGRYVEIMEYIDDSEDFYDFVESYDADAEYYCDDCIRQMECETEEEFERRYNKELRLMRKAASTIEYLEGIFGYTTDNAQIGYNEDGDLVAYDYGFEPCNGCRDIYCSPWEIVDAIDEDLKEYINSLISFLEYEEEMLRSWEDEIIQDYRDEDEEEEDE